MASLQWAHQSRLLLKEIRLKTTGNSWNTGSSLRKRSLLPREIHKTFPQLTTTDDDGVEAPRERTLDELKAAFLSYCTPRKNITFERHKFNTRNQAEGESIDQYATELQTLASSCEFGDLKDSLIRDRIVCGVRGESMKERLLRDADLTLIKALDMCRANEISKKQMKSLHGHEDKTDISYVKKNQRHTKPPKGTADKKEKTFECRNCGRTHEARKCPAYNKACN